MCEGRMHEDRKNGLPAWCAGWAIVFLFLAGNAVSFAQKPGFGYHNPSADRFGNNTLTVQLYPIIFNGYGLEYSRNIYGQRHFLKVSPVIYASSNYTSNQPSSLQNLFGFSIGLYHQYNYFEITDVGFRLFFQWGVFYQNLDMTNVAQASNHIEKCGLDVAIGFRQNIAKPLYFEFYVGYGQRWLLRSQIDNSKVAAGITDPEVIRPHFDKNMFDYGRGGSVLVVGLNLGFLF